MHVNLVGINHRTAPVDVRERVAIGTGKLPEALSSLQTFLSHGIILSTCNRTEVYSIDDDGQEDSTQQNPRRSSTAFSGDRLRAFCKRDSDHSGSTNPLRSRGAPGQTQLALGT